MCVCVCARTCTHMCLVLSDFCDPHAPSSTRLFCLWDFPGKNTGVNCHFLLQGLFLTQGSNLSLLHLLYWQVDTSPLSQLGSLQKMWTISMSFLSWFIIKQYIDGLFIINTTKESNMFGRTSDYTNKWNL